MHGTTPETPQNPDQSALLRWTPRAVFLVALFFLSGRLALGPVFGIWQGPFLDESGAWPRPLISSWLQTLLASLDGDAPLRAGTVLSAIFASGACALVARLTIASTPAYSTPIRALAGLSAGLLLLCTAPIALSGTTIGPTTLTLFAAIASLAALFNAHGSDRPWRSLAISGFALGIAVANHPSFALMIPVLILFALPASRILEWWTTAVAVIAIPFALACALPYVASITAGESTNAFWEHALRTPYPVIGERPPNWTVPRALPLPGSWPLLALASIGALGIAFSGSARYAWPLLATALIFGPLLPALSHHPALPAVPVDSSATQGIAAAALIVLATRGTLSVALRMSSAPPLQFVAATSFLFISVWGLYGQLPSRAPDISRDIALHLIDEPPENSIVIAGDPYTASLLAATQSIEGIRQDLIIVPPGMLTTPLRRDALADDAQLNMNVDFPPRESWVDWAHQRPNEYVKLIDLDGIAGAEGYFTMLDELAQWDLLLNNYRDHPICFVGTTPGWATARARRLDAMAQFPQTRIAPGRRVRVLDVWARNEALRHEPGGAETLAHILGTMSELTRKQASVQRATDFATAARRRLPSDPTLLLSALRASARTGDSRGPSALLRADPHSATTNTLAPGWTDKLKADLATAATEQTWLSPGRPNLSESQAREALNRLWVADEIYLAERLAARATTWFPKKSSFFFDRAAALAQMGRIEDAESAVQRWAAMVPLPWEALELELKADGRFVLLYDLLGPPEIPSATSPALQVSNLGTDDESGNVIAARR